MGAACAAIALVGVCAACGTNDGPSVSGPAPDNDTASVETNDAGREVDSHRGDRAEKATNPHAKDESTEESAEDVDVSTAKPERRRGRTYRVTDVVDGDTVHLAKRGETSVRIIGIDTPETVDPNTPDECGGPAASAEAERLLSGQRVRLVYDPTQGRVDSYGRVLGYLDVPGVGDYGRHMIARGLAAEYTYASVYRRRARYVAAQRRAQAADRGVWKRCGGVDTPLEQPEPTAEPRTQAPPADSGASCATGYDPCVPPGRPDLDCSDVDGPIRISGDDPHRFDADGDGIGCDS